MPLTWQPLRGEHSLVADGRWRYELYPRHRTGGEWSLCSTAPGTRVVHGTPEELKIMAEMWEAVEE